MKAGSVEFSGAEIAISKLEPYLGKVLINPPQDALGSTEWIGLVRKDKSIPTLVLGYMLMLPELCEGYRRLQSGKRHARMDPEEVLDLRVKPIPNARINVNSGGRCITDSESWILVEEVGDPSVVGVGEG